MKGKILLVVGIGIGYVLGTRAGREKYDQMKAAAQKLWNDPRVQKQVNNAEGFVKDKAPDVAEFLSDSAKKVVSQVSGSKAPARKAPAKASTAKSAAAK
ncbi:MAG: YtxH domain-containing protein [Salinibacterium sp.]|nr:YtxH domain-containing protein [Salinibacterium sp.]